MADYTERFSEVWSLLADIDPASYNTEQNTGYVCLDRYHRAVVIIHTGVISGNLDVDLEQGTDTSGSGGKTLDSGGKDITLTATTDNNTVSVIEIRTAELDVSGRFDCINVEVTPGAAGIFGVQIWGGVPRYAPVSTSNLDSVTD
jgi:hypothetical protein